ncbi:VPLPA-CTERM sorting domain-containing protein [Dinoroseobacter sp. S124A]|uniref:VPLPA-CTERM sorting domain-containing protein n=1 Tax=Dinoroseobacter sp. S124A TaxID=3415128 RepID=UPI003C7E3DF6
MRRFSTISLGLACAGLCMASAPALAATTLTVTFSSLYNEVADQCVSSGTEGGIAYQNPGTCAAADHAVLGGGKTDFPGLVLEATGPVASFDLLAIEIINSFPEVLGVPRTVLPSGVDPTTTAGYAYVWDNNLWSPVAVDNLHMRGLREGAVVAEASYFIPDTCLPGLGGCPSVTLPNGDGPIAGVFEEIDRLEIAVVPGFGPATEFGILGDDTYWYTCLGPCGRLVLDNVALRITPVNGGGPVDPGPTPIPLPAGGWLILAGLGALRAVGRSRE